MTSVIRLLSTDMSHRQPLIVKGNIVVWNELHTSRCYSFMAQYCFQSPRNWL